MNTKKVSKYYVTLLAIISMIAGKMFYLLFRCNQSGMSFVYTIIQIAMLCFLILIYIIIKKQFSKEEWDDKIMVFTSIIIPFIIGIFIFSFLMGGV